MSRGPKRANPRPLLPGGPGSKVVDEESFRACMANLRSAMQRLESTLADSKQAHEAVHDSSLRDALGECIAQTYEEARLAPGPLALREYLLARTVRTLNLARTLTKEPRPRGEALDGKYSPYLWMWWRELGILVTPNASDNPAVYWSQRANEILAFVRDDLAEISGLVRQKKFVAFLEPRLRTQLERRSADLAAIDESYRFEAAIAVLLQSIGTTVLPAGLSEDLREKTDLCISFLGDESTWHRLQVSRSSDPSTTDRKHQTSGPHAVVLVTPITLSRWLLKRSHDGVFDLGELFRWLGVITADPQKLAQNLASALPKWVVRA